MTLKRVPVRSRRDIPLRIGDSTPSRNVVAVAAPDNLRFSVPGDFIRYGDDGVVSEDETSRLPAEVDLLTSVRCPDLTKVSLLTSDEELYKSLCSDRLWELLSANGEPLLCRVGDKLPGHQDLLVADCEPTKQGLLTPETQVCLTCRKRKRKRKIRTAGVFASGWIPLHFTLASHRQERTRANRL